jgi:hypothetical protein
MAPVTLNRPVGSSVAETVGLGREAEGTRRVPRLTKRRAEDLLDWLEAHGCQGRPLPDGEGFAVEFGPLER